MLLVSIFSGDSDLPFEGKWIKLDRPVANRFFDFEGWKELLKIILKFKPDIIQANAADTLKFSVFSKKLFGWKAPIIYRNANQMGDFIKGSFHRKFNQYLINQVSAVISVSKASQVDFHKTFDFPERKSISIPIGIDTKAIDEGLRENWEASIPYDFLLQIGGLVEEKNPHGMLRIFSELHKIHPNLHLVFMGSGPLQHSLEEQIANQNLKDIVHLIPSRKNIFPILAKAKALVMPSKIEGLPGVILEAMYCEIPVIAYNVGGISEVLENKETGWLVEAGDEDKFKESILEVLNSPSSELEKITSAAQALVLKNHQIEHVAREFERFYFDVIAPARHGGRIESWYLQAEN